MVAGARITIASLALLVLAAAFAGHAQDYVPPEASAGRLKGVDFSAAVPVDEAYRHAFVACDGANDLATGKDHFLEFDLTLAGVPAAKQYYLCSRDPSQVKALLRLADGGIYWDSKMALDVDGSWAAWNGRPGATDLKETAYKWPGSANASAQSAQIDPDRIPYIVMPTAGLRKITGDKSKAMGRMFADKTGLRMGDMGVVIYKDGWTPVLIGDGGPFMRLGEGSSRVFEAIGETRCKTWSEDGQTCTGAGNVYPYKNYGLSKDVIFILYPGSRQADITPANAIEKMCAFAKEKLGLEGGRMCP